MSTETNKEGALRNKVWIKPVDQMDVWLDSEGLYRKHTAKDGTCLFRAVSEQLFLTQAVHQEVRKLVTEYELRHSEFFQKLIICPLVEYVEKMRNPWEWGGQVEIEALAQMYKHDFKLYKEIGKPAEAVTHYGHPKIITLCYTQDKHYDSVYTKEYISTASYCQSVIYELLYKKVFALKEVDYAVRKMLHDKTSRYQREHFPFLSSGFALRLEMRDSCLNVKDLLDFGITPFPYKVAKSLDPEVYRNVEYDTWNEYRKGLRYGFCAWNCRDLQVGVKCQVKLEDNVYHGHIQEMQANKGPVKVFIEELGEKMFVPYESLELLPPTPQPAASSRNLLPFKLAQLQLSELKSEEVWQKGKRILKSIVMRQKAKENHEKQCKENSKEMENEDIPVVSSSDCYDQEIEYSGEEKSNYHPQNYMSHSTNDSEDQAATPDSTKPYSGVPIIVPTVEPYRYQTYPQTSHPIPPMTLPLADVNTHSFPCSPVAINLMASKSMNVDGSDLPHSDVATLRFFYNLGLDHMRMNCYLRPGPPCYVNSSGIPQGFVSVENVPSQHLDANTPQPLSGMKKNNVYEGMPLIQQCEVSSTNNNGISVPVSPAYYPAMECEPYCMTMPYVDYNVYDYSPVYAPPHNFPPSSYITPEGVVYQHILPPGIVSTTPPL
ncbi:ovarian tumor isoform X2 [Rhodnius prolixus]|uniref:ovarian tumor isoform X2 n=1 Tax=Rhodnius prolixus TaxID=13249 RepID=UPI003D188786